MVRTLTLALSLLFVAAIPAGAAEKKEEGKAAVGQYVDISPVAIPIIWNGRLINYAFTYVRVHLAPNADAIGTRTKEPYFRDALVRIAHRTPFTRLDDFTRIDEAKLRAALLPAVSAIAGPKVVTGVAVTSQQPKRATGLPKPPQAPAAPPAPPASHE
ncbi:MAG: hypothetical protein ABIO39_01400 [Caulobacteraceae bacterium]